MVFSRDSAGRVKLKRSVSETSKKSAMPELPEVETVVRELRPRLLGRRLRSVTTSDKNLRFVWQPAWNLRLKGRRRTL